MEDKFSIGVSKGDNGRAWLSSRTKWTLFVKGKFPVWAQAATVVIGIAAVLISLATLFVVERQAWIYDEQRRMMAEQMEITRKAARAYVGVARVDADLENSKVIVLLQNVGRIPAKNIKVILLESRHKSDGSSLATLDPRSFEGQDLFGTLNMQLSLPLGPLQQGEADDILAKNEILYVNVTIQYYDGFAIAEKTESLYQFDGPASNNWTLVPTSAK